MDLIYTTKQVTSWQNGPSFVRIRSFLSTFCYSAFRVEWHMWDIFCNEKIHRFLSWNCLVTLSTAERSFCDKYLMYVIQLWKHCNCDFEVTATWIFVFLLRVTYGPVMQVTLSRNRNSQKLNRGQQKSNFCWNMGDLVIQSQSSGIFGDCCTWVWCWCLWCLKVY